MSVRLGRLSLVLFTVLLLGSVDSAFATTYENGYRIKVHHYYYPDSPSYCNTINEAILLVDTYNENTDEILLIPGETYNESFDFGAKTAVLKRDPRSAWASYADPVINVGSGSIVMSEDYSKLENLTIRSSSGTAVQAGGSRPAYPCSGIISCSIESTSSGSGFGVVVYGENKYCELYDSVVSGFAFGAVAAGDYADSDDTRLNVSQCYFLYNSNYGIYITENATLNIYSSGIYYSNYGIYSTHLANVISGSVSIGNCGYSTYGPGTWNLN